MSILTTTEQNIFAVSENQRRLAGRPYDDKGHRVSRACPHCYGVLQYEGNGFWRCDGLIDPPRDDMELQCCTYTHEDGTALRHPERT